MLNNVKNTAIPNILDLLAPHICRGCGKTGKVVCECCKKNIISTHQNFCPFCKKPNQTGACQNCHNLPPIFIVGNRSSLIGILAHDFKYYSIRALKNPLAEILNQVLPDIDGKISIVPLPTTAAHIRQRGLDHTYLIAKQLAKLRSKNYRVEKLLLRTKNTVQVGADRKTRFSQAQDAYSINHKIKIDSNATYILFDDVWTTGASMLSAIKKLRESGATKIIIAILALSTLEDK